MVATKEECPRAHASTLLQQRESRLYRGTSLIRNRPTPPRTTIALVAGSTLARRVAGAGNADVPQEARASILLRKTDVFIHLGAANATR